MVGVTIKSISYVGKRPIYKRRDVLLFLSTCAFTFFFFLTILTIIIGNSSLDRRRDDVFQRVRFDSCDGCGDIDPFELYVVNIHA